MVCSEQCLNSNGEQELSYLHSTIIKMYDIDKLSLQKIASRLGYSFYCIRKILLENGVRMRDKTFGSPWQKKYQINNYAFQKIDSAEKAYWLGFIYADGNICGNRFRIVLHKKDYSHLEKLRQFLGYTGEVKMRGKYRELSVYDRKFIIDLKNKGVVERKSLTITFPSIKKTYFKSFILGYFDGDGSFYMHLKKFKCQISIYTGSKKFLESIRKILRQNKFKPSKLYKEKKSTTYYIRFYDYKAIKFGIFLYNKELQLERKLGKLDMLDSIIREKARYINA